MEYIRSNLCTEGEAAIATVIQEHFLQPALQLKMNEKCYYKIFFSVFGVFLDQK